MREMSALFAGLWAVAGLATAAQARQVEFVSPHPVPHKFGGGFCTIEVPHVHNYPPEDPRMYREAHGKYYFVGDPTPFGYEGPRYVYYGAHPVAEAEARLGHPVFCYIKGPHFHWYRPPHRAHFEFSGGAYWYVGAFPRVYYDQRPRFAAINEAYAPVLYTRPVVDVAVAPLAVRAHVSLGGPGWSAHAIATGPPVPVPVPAPPPPAPAVQVEVGIHLGDPAVVVEHPHGSPPIRHDRGRHEGWRNRPSPKPRRSGDRPSRFVVGPAPVRKPLLQRRRSPAPTSRAAPAPRSASAPAPARKAATAPRLQAPGPARGPAAPAGHSQKDDRPRR
ncbi:MAG: hypothetical protein JXP73_10565 [Deltaproteobacteria bacterium]|nr:hypothetical protein [Deltaproteobacteria bacterium]